MKLFKILLLIITFNSYSQNYYTKYNFVQKFDIDQSGFSLLENEIDTNDISKYPFIVIVGTMEFFSTKKHSFFIIKASKSNINLADNEKVSIGFIDKKGMLFDLNNKSKKLISFIELDNMNFNSNDSIYKTKVMSINSQIEIEFYKSLPKYCVNKFPFKNNLHGLYSYTSDNQKINLIEHGKSKLNFKKDIKEIKNKCTLMIE